MCDILNFSGGGHVRLQSARNLTPKEKKLIKNMLCSKKALIKNLIN